MGRGDGGVTIKTFHYGDGAKDPDLQKHDAWSPDVLGGGRLNVSLFRLLPQQALDII